MSTQTSLEPAHSIIQRLGGPEKVQAITGASRTRVYRWTQPRENGGTGGVIPFQHVPALIAHGRAENIAISADDFIPGPAPKKEGEAA